MLCCIFNYPPLYRQSIYLAIDKACDARFYFGSDTGTSEKGIEKMDISLFRRPVGEIRNKQLWGKHPWRSGVIALAFKKEYSRFLISGDFNWAYFPFLLFCKLLGKKVYAWGHGFKNLERSGCFKKLFVNALDGYFIYSSRGKKRMEELGFDSSRIQVIYNSLTDENSVEALEEKNRTLGSDVYKKYFGNELPVLIFSGRLTEVKHIEWLIDALADHVESGLNYNLVLIGEGEIRERLEELAMRRAVGGRVWFYGACYEDEKLGELLYNATLCVSPGNVGLTAIHAMSYGVPVISHDDFETQMPEYEVITEGKTGALYRHGDFEDMKRCIKEWLESEKDREELRMNCYREICSHWNSSAQLHILSPVINCESSQDLMI